MTHVAICSSGLPFLSSPPAFVQELQAVDSDHGIPRIPGSRDSLQGEVYRGIDASLGQGDYEGCFLPAPVELACEGDKSSD
jgi:hypothetical protein